MLKIARSHLHYIFSCVWHLLFRYCLALRGYDVSLNVENVGVTATFIYHRIMQTLNRATEDLGFKRCCNWRNIPRFSVIRNISQCAALQYVISYPAYWVVQQNEIETCFKIYHFQQYNTLGYLSACQS